MTDQFQLQVGGESNAEFNQTNFNALAQQVYDLTEKNEKLQKRLREQEKQVRFGIKDIADTKNLTILGFIILLFMMGTVIVGVANNIWGENHQQQPQPIIIYATKP